MIEARRRLWGELAIGIVVLCTAIGASQTVHDDPSPLVERTEVGLRTSVVATLEAEGRYLPGEGTEEQPVEPIELTVRTRLEYLDQLLEVSPEGIPRRVGRRVEVGEVAIGGPEPIRPSTMSLRPEVAELVAELGEGGEVVVASPRGPLTRAELELVQLPADPMAMTALLPSDPAGSGDTWPLPDSAARSISGYDVLASQSLEATLRKIDPEEAEIDLRGRVEGAGLGGRGRMDVEGSLRFDRRAGRIASLTLRRSERREAGPVEAGLEFRSTLRVDRSDAPADAAAIPAPRESGPLPEPWLLLSYSTPDGRYRLEHDRYWYVFTEDDRQTTLRRLEGSTVVAQANFVAGPTVEPGARPDADRFRADVRKALGDRYDRIIDAGQVSAPPGESRYRLAIGGRQGSEPIVWYYYLVSDPSGRQLVAIFTLRESEVQRLGRRDQRMIDSLRWREAPADADAPGTR